MWASERSREARQARGRTCLACRRRTCSSGSPPAARARRRRRRRPRRKTSCRRPPTSKSSGRTGELVPPQSETESLTVTWDAVAGATGYRIACNYLSYNNWRKCGKDNSNNWKLHRTTAGTTGVTVSHLDGPTDNANTGSWERMTFGSEYSVIVQAMNGSAAGTWSAPFDARPAYPIYLMSGEGVPPSYQILNASKRTVTGFTLAWTQPYRASGYAAECVEIVGGQESGSWTKCSEDANVFSEKQVSGLQRHHRPSPTVRMAYQRPHNHRHCH